MTVTIRPATGEDVAATRTTFPDLQKDHWAEGKNRRSFVAEDDHGRVVGFCRAIDNNVHPDSRVMLLEVLPELREQGIEDQLLRSQLEVSTVPPHMKIHADQKAEQRLAARFGGIAIQVTPPWRYVVVPELRDWAAEHAGGAEPTRETDGRALQELEVDHYIAQHESWSPTVPREQLLEELAEDHDPSSPTTWNRERSRVLRRGDEIVAAALVWGGSNGAGVDAPEVSLLSRPYLGPSSRRDKEACLAAVVAASADGDELLLDSHLSLPEETAMMQAVPGLEGTPETDWMAIIALPVPDGPAPIAFPRERVPAEASWVHGFLPDTLPR